jgi:hypothetical protein
MRKYFVFLCVITRQSAYENPDFPLDDHPLQVVEKIINVLRKFYGLEVFFDLVILMIVRVRTGKR